MGIARSSIYEMPNTGADDTASSGPAGPIAAARSSPTPGPRCRAVGVQVTEQIIGLRVPIRLERRGGRKLVVAPDHVPAKPPRRDEVLIVNRH